MANIVINKIANRQYVVIHFNDSMNSMGFDYKIFWLEDIASIGVDVDNSFVAVDLKYESRDWKFSLDGKFGTIRIDTIDGDTPADNNELATMLADLKG